MDVTLCSLSAGGIAHYSYALADALQSAGLETTVLMHDHPEYDLAGYPHRHGTSTELVMGISPARRVLAPAKNLAVMLKTTRRSDVVHFQWALGPRSDRLYWPILRKLGKKLVYTAHDVLPHEPEIMSLEHCRWVYDFADALIVHGENLKALLLERFDVDPRKVHVIPHGNYNFVADTASRWNRATARQSFGYTDEDRVVLFFGLIRPYKGLDDLIEAVRIVRDGAKGRSGRVRLLVAGRPLADHWKEGRYEALLAEAGLTEDCHLHLEHIAMLDVPRFFHAADVVAVPYKRGSQSGVLQLAYSFAKAAVATRVGSLPEVTRSGENARLVAPEAPAELAAVLGDLLFDPDAAAALGARARRYADTELGWPQIAKKTQAVYAGLPA